MKVPSCLRPNVNTSHVPSLKTLFGPEVNHPVPIVRAAPALGVRAANHDVEMRFVINELVDCLLGGSRPAGDDLSTRTPPGAALRHAVPRGGTVAPAVAARVLGADVVGVCLARTREARVARARADAVLGTHLVVGSGSWVCRLIIKLGSKVEESTVKTPDVGPGCLIGRCKSQNQSGGGAGRY